MKFIFLLFFVVVNIPFLNFAHSQDIAGLINSQCRFQEEVSELIECGTLMVEENHFDPNGKKFELPYLKIKAVNPSPNYSPWLFLPGGPGGAVGIANKEGAEWWATAASIFAPHRDFIIMEIRGTRDTFPTLNCPILNTAAVAFNAYPAGKRPLSSKSLIDEEFKNCRIKLKRSGVTLSLTNRLQVTYDVKALLDHLGIEKTSLFGVSYGTTYAMTVASEFPDLIDLMILDSVFPPELTSNINETLHFDKTLKKIFRACQKQKKCNEAYPKLDEKFFELFNALEENPLEITFVDHSDFVVKTALLDKRNFIEFLMIMLATERGGDQMLAQFPEIIFNKNIDVLEYWFQFYAADRVSNNFSYGANLSSVCYDLPLDLDLTQMSTGISSFRKAVIEAWNINHCKNWHAERLGEKHRKRLNTDIPTLILNSKLDTLTPLHQAQIAARGLSKSYFFEFSGGLHSLYRHDTCAIYLIQEFLFYHQERPILHCAENMAEFEFQTNFKEWVSPFVVGP